MKEQNFDRYRFDYLHGRVEFDVFFFIDETPFILLFGAKEYNLSFEFKVEKGFKVIPYMNNEEYTALCNALSLTYDPNNRFSPKAFLEKFNVQVPKTAQNSGQPKPEQIAKYRRVVEEADKIYFYGWRNNQIRGDKVSPENLEKTRILLGNKAYDICKRKNISSRWIDKKENAVEFYSPS